MPKKLLVLLLFFHCDKQIPVIQDPIQVISESLQVAYDLSKIESNTYATLFYTLQDSIVSWHLIASTIQIESQYNPLAINQTSKCKGMMQLKESTAEYLSKKLDMKYKHNETVYNPISNITLGTQYLKDNSNISGTIKEKIHHTVQCFVGGPKYNKNNGYTKYYRKQILKEYNKLIYIERGIKWNYQQMKRKTN
jgi:soluble lytic murein transglycosylase-like protein